MSDKNRIQPGQRWISETEPELGLGTVTNLTAGRIELRFETSEITRLYVLNRAPVKRVLFQKGDALTLKNGDTAVVSEVREADGLVYYRMGEKEFCETELSDTLPAHTPWDRLKTLSFDPLAHFELRYRTLHCNAKIKQSPVRGFCGARIDLFPHQLYIADTVSNRYQPRVMLADQVGLGKTIEAALIIKKLILSERINSVLIIAPEHLVLQWFGELYHRFSLSFAVIDLQYCRNEYKKAADFDPFDTKRFCICSNEAFSLLAELRSRALGSDWDLVLMDEIHNLLQSDEEYPFYKELAHLTDSLLLLTAIPEYPNLEDFFSRLHLLDPGLYTTYDHFFWEVDNLKRTAALAERIYSKKKLTPDDLAFLKKHIPPAYLGGKSPDEITIRNDKEIRQHILDYLIDQHGMGRLLFRNTRRTVTGFPARQVHMISLPLPSTDSARRSLQQEIFSDLGENTLPGKYEFEEDHRLKWLASLLEKDEKTLLICSNLEKTLGISKILTEKGFKNFLTFHEELAFLERDRRVANFQNSSGPGLMISSEIGSEGRNFQFCRNLVFFDIPFDPSLIEQRIGRLDRIGQPGPINIFVLYHEGSPREILARWLHEGLNIFNESHEGHIQVFRLFNNLVKKMMLSGGSHTGELTQLILDTHREYQKIKKRNAAGRDVLVEFNSFNSLHAAEILESIRAQDTDSFFESCLVELLEFHSFELEKEKPQTYRITRTGSQAFAQLSTQGKVITFAREQATNRHDYLFLTQDHELTSRAIELLLGQTVGNTTCAVWWQKEEKDALFLEAVYILECVAPKLHNPGRYLPGVPVRVLINQNGDDFSAQVSFSDLCNQLSPADKEQTSELGLLLREYGERMIQAAAESAERQALLLKQEAREKVEATIGEEVKRLQALKQVNNHIKEEEIRHLQQEFTEVNNYINSARIRLDSLRLIRRFRG